MLLGTNLALDHLNSLCDRRSPNAHTHPDVAVFRAPGFGIPVIHTKANSSISTSMNVLDCLKMHPLYTPRVT